tara:strand:+ start:978 stop:1436 length:459 start_codon:yes stop_codon:yes gene_type:complete
MNNVKDKVKNNIDATKHTRKKNLLTALDKSFDELNTSTDWTAVKPQEASYSCCSSCIFGSPQFDDRENAITYNDQDLASFRISQRENKDNAYWYGRESHSGEYIYLQHRGTSHKNYKELIQVLNNHGIYVAWDWSSNTKLRVFLAKYKGALL